MADFQARVVLSAKNTAGAPIRQLRNDLRGLMESFRGLGHTTGLRDVQRQFVNLGRTIGDVHRRHVAPLLRSVASLTGMAGALSTLLGGFTAVGFVTAMNTSRDSIDKFSKSSRKINMPIDQMRAYAHVADLAGVSTEEFTGGMVQANRTVAQMHAGIGRANTRLKELNPTLRAQMMTAKSSTEAVDFAMQAMHDAIQSGDRGLASELSATIFGGDFTALAEMSAKEFRDAYEDAFRLIGPIGTKAGLEIENFNDRFTDLIASIVGTRDALAAELLPSLTPIVKQWTEWLSPKNRGEFVKSIADPIKSVVRFLKELDWKAVGQGFREAGNGIATVARAINSLATIAGGWDKLIIGLIALKTANATGLTGLLGGAAAGAFVGAPAGAAAAGGTSAVPPVAAFVTLAELARRFIAITSGSAQRDNLAAPAKSYDQGEAQNRENYRRQFEGVPFEGGMHRAGRGYGPQPGQKVELGPDTKAFLGGLFGQVPRRAMGGPLAAGQTAIVGEHGPELFRPSRAGVVVPAPETRSILDWFKPFGRRTAARRSEEEQAGPAVLEALAQTIEMARDANAARHAIRLARLPAGEGYGTEAMRAKAMHAVYLAGARGEDLSLEANRLRAEAVRLRALPRRAKGGPLAAGQTAIVGEEGPELFRADGGLSGAAAQGETGALVRAMMGPVRAVVAPFRPLTSAVDDLTRVLRLMMGGPGGLPGAGGPLGALSSLGTGAGLAGVREALRRGNISVPGGSVGGRMPGKGFFDAIIAAEGTAVKGDPYQEVLGYGAYGRPGKPLTSMTLDEVKEFGLGMRRAQAARGTAWNRTSSASGAFQITGSTMMDAARALGMDPATTIYDEATQKRMALWIAKTQGLGAWEGFKAHPDQRRAASAALAAGVDPASGTAGPRESVGRVRPNIAGPGSPLAFTGRYRRGVDDRLTKILEQASLEFPDYRAEAISGYRPGDPRFHGKGMATDVALFDRKSGAKLANYQDASTFEAYEKFAQTARRVQQRMYPELDKAMRWGGYFSGGAGKYGAMDPMHFDLGGERVGMAGGSWDRGLTQQQRRLWPGARSAGLAALANHHRDRTPFTPAMREQGYRAAEVPASKVEIGKGSFDIKVSLDQGLSASGVSVKQPENMVANVGVDRTGSFKPSTGTKSGMRGPR